MMIQVSPWGRVLMPWALVMSAAEHECTWTILLFELLLSAGLLGTETRDPISFLSKLMYTDPAYLLCPNTVPSPLEDRTYFFHIPYILLSLIFSCRYPLSISYVISSEFYFSALHKLQIYPVALLRSSRKMQDLWFTIMDTSVLSMNGSCTVVNIPAVQPASL